MSYLSELWDEYFGVDEDDYDPDSVAGENRRAASESDDDEGDES
jgi:hypothetical protein